MDTKDESVSIEVGLTAATTAAGGNTGTNNDDTPPAGTRKTNNNMDTEATQPHQVMNGMSEDITESDITSDVMKDGLGSSECSSVKGAKENWEKDKSEHNSHKLEVESKNTVDCKEQNDKLLNGEGTADISDEDILVDSSGDVDLLDEDKLLNDDSNADTLNEDSNAELSDDDIISNDCVETKEVKPDSGNELNKEECEDQDPHISNAHPAAVNNDQVKQECETHDLNSDAVANGTNCDNCEEQTEKSRELNLKTKRKDKDSERLNDTTDKTSESLELISETERTVEDNSGSSCSQNVTNESEEPSLLLELSHESECSEPKVLKEKTKDLQDNCIQQLEVKDLIKDNSPHVKESMDVDTESKSEKMDIQDGESNKPCSETGSPDKASVDTNSAMEVCNNKDITSEQDTVDTTASTGMKDARLCTTTTTQPTSDSVDSQKSDLIDSVPVMKTNDCQTEVKHNVFVDGYSGKISNNSSSTDSKTSPLFNKNTSIIKTDNKVKYSFCQKGKKLDQLLSKITTKAESVNVKSNENTIPKKAKARKSFASSSMKSSSCIPSSTSSSVTLPVSSASITSLTFNVKELEKRGVLDMPKPSKRKAFDPVKKKPIEQRDQDANIVDISLSDKTTNISPVRSPVKNESPFFTKGKVLKGKRKKAKRSGGYRLPGEKNRKSRKKDSEERQLSEVEAGDKAMSVTDKVRKARALEQGGLAPGAGVKAPQVEGRAPTTGAGDADVQDKDEDINARNAFNESLGLSRKTQVVDAKVSETGLTSNKPNAMDIMTKNSKLSFSTNPSSTMKKAKKSVRHGIDSTSHQTLDSFLKGATYSQMNSSLKQIGEHLSSKAEEESTNSGSADVRKRKATESPCSSPVSRGSTGSPSVTHDDKKRKVEGVTSPRPSQLITLVPTGSPPVPMHSVMTSSSSGAAPHPIILSPPGASSGTQTLIQNGTLNGMPMFQIVGSMASSQPPQILAISGSQAGTRMQQTAGLQPKGMPVLLAPVQMTPITTVACSLQSKALAQSSAGNSPAPTSVLGQHLSTVAPNMVASSLLKSLISPAMKTHLPNGQLLDGQQPPRAGPNGLYLVTPPKTPEHPPSETNSNDSVEVSPGGVVPPDKDVIPLCTCRISGASFQKMASTVTYCQSLDSVDGKVMGCCNKVTTMQLVRPAVKIPFLAVCESHRKRLRSHQCCPGCGHYCTQGRFVQCRKEGGGLVHLFHEQCQVRRGGRHFCPHCGQPSAQVLVHLTMQQHKPSVINDNKPPRTQTKARIHMKEKKVGSGDDSGDDTAVSDHTKKPLTASEIFIGPDKYSLERFLSSLQGERPKKFRHLPKCLYTPAYDNDLERVVYMLEDDHNAREQYEDLEGQGALHASAIIGSLPITHVLVQAGASVHMQDKTLRTPLMYAAENNHPDVVSYLLRAGAIINAKADDGMTALHYAAKMGHVGIIRQLLDTELVSVDITDDGGWTPLIWAVEHKQLESVKLLLKRNTDPNLRDTEENTTIHWAAFAGNVAVAELLLSASCDLDSLNMHGDRPLHIAARQDHYECVVLFLARGSDVEAKNNKGESPLECCLEQSSATYLALRVNKQLKGFGAKHMGRPEKLLHRDLSKGRENIPIPCVNAADDDGIPTDYLYVTDNIETTNLNINRVIGSLQSCQCKDDCSSIYCACGKNSVRCWYDKYGRLVPEFNMLEPPLIFECNRACECWTTCNNRVVQNGVMSRLQVFKTVGRGWGCRTLVDITRGTFICEYIGEHISDSEADRREDDSYLFDLDNRDGETYCIDARRYGNIARFINHLCEPNLVPVKVFVDSQDLRFPRICLFASRDIKAMEELGFDYGEKFWIIKWKQFTCTCGSGKCRYSQDTIHKTLEEYRQRHEDEAEIVPE